MFSNFRPLIRTVPSLISKVQVSPFRTVCQTCHKSQFLAMKQSHVVTSRAAFAKLANEKPLKKSDEKIVVNKNNPSKRSRKKTKDKLNESLEAVAYCTAEEYNLDELEHWFANDPLYQVVEVDTAIENAILVWTSPENVSKDGEESFGQIFLFREGSVVFWNVSPARREEVLNVVSMYQTNPHDSEIVEKELETMDYKLEEIDHSRLSKDLIHLRNVEAETTGLIKPSILDQYSFSNAIALSVKLAIHESSLAHFNDSVQFLIGNMKRGGKVGMNLEQVYQKTGQLFELRHQINMDSDFLDTPDFYWDRPELEKLFNHTCSVLNVTKRTKLMNDKLNYCYELMELITSHLHEKHSAKLEWYIIALISIEIVFELPHLYEWLTGN